ncbi:Tex family protein [Synechococcus sp. PCC 7336]|uniref:Tex family protein n=1 Tax=Synechococcus sp. PCC 7336 TaxID=195250 RepID=UPI00034979A7|nr:Tex family protein [Synechococcus sp. PCC 7336]
MLDFVPFLARELSLRPAQVQNALELLGEGATVPFIARYRKERTGEMDETQLRALQDRYTYLKELEERKTTVLDAIASQNKLTDALRAKIEACVQKTELEDLYLPYRPKRRTRAAIAREKGLEPLAEFIRSLNRPNATPANLEGEASRYVDAVKGVESAADALKGASDILAEAVAEQAELRAYLREFLLKSGEFAAKIKSDYPEGSTKFEMYRDYRKPLRGIAPHNVLALLRGQAEGILTLKLKFDEGAVLSHLADRLVRSRAKNVREFYAAMLSDALQRLLKPSLTAAAIATKKAWADAESIQTFAANLKDLLLAAPAGMKPTLGIDPGFRTGCKVAALDRTGKFLEYRAIFPHQSQTQREEAAQFLRQTIARHGIELIAIGNGTASRETDAFVTEAIADLKPKPIQVTVSEAGASVYSASEVAIAEFPDLDVTVRGAIAIGRRLQDPLAELVKVEPKSIGVGQYQHDVEQKLLKKQLDETVESCVNFVGVDLNTASKELLTYVAGLTAAVANNIVNYRNENGAFGDRRQLLEVPKLGPKAFEQAAGFLRIRDGKQPLDNTAVHPESYAIVKAIASDLGRPLDQLVQSPDRLQSLDLQRYVSDSVGEPTLRDIVRELEKPGRDPRAQFTYATFAEGIDEIADLAVGMELEGVVTNVANFGAFVDIGVHQDGLVHISQLADRFVRDPKEVVKVGQVVKVRVLEINEQLSRISLSMKAAAAERSPSQRPVRKPRH